MTDKFLGFAVYLSMLRFDVDELSNKLVPLASLIFYRM